MTSAKDRHLHALNPNHTPFSWFASQGCARCLAIATYMAAVQSLAPGAGERSNDAPRGESFASSHGVQQMGEPDSGHSEVQKAPGSHRPAAFRPTGGSRRLYATVPAREKSSRIGSKVDSKVVEYRAVAGTASLHIRR